MVGKALKILFVVLIIGAGVYFYQPEVEVETEVGPVRVLLGGDIYAGNRIKTDLELKGPEYFVGELAQIARGADLHIANLESPITKLDTTSVEKSFLFSSFPEVALPILNSLDVDGVIIANNHIMDYEVAGLQDTIKHLDAAGIKYAGAGLNRSQAEREVVFERNGKKIALLAFSNTFPRSFWSTENKPGTAFGEFSRVKNRVSDVSADADYTIVSFHWGAELDTTPQTYQKNLARGAIDSGADIVFGHHPHVIQPVESYSDKYIFYSLGNYFFTTLSHRVNHGLLVDLQLDAGEVKDVKFHVTNVNNYQTAYRPNLFQTFTEPSLLAAYIKQPCFDRIAHR